MKFKLLIPMLFALLCSGFSTKSFAVTCSASSHAFDTVSVNQNVQIADNQPVGGVVWQSNTLAVSITCRDTDHMPGGEMAYIYVDPDNQFSRFLQGTGLDLFVRVQGRDYGVAGGRIPLQFQATKPTTATNCVRNGRYLNNNGCVAVPNTFTLEFSLVLKRGSGQITALSHSSNGLKVFVVDGVGSINRRNGVSVNYGPTLNGLTNITRISCNPVVSIQGDGNTNQVSFGRINVSEARTNQYAANHVTRFKVIAEDSAGLCTNVDFRLSFTTLNPTANNATLILPESDSDFGIGISPENTGNNITLGAPIDFGGGFATHREKSFAAKIFWLTNKPKVGPFNASATATITFK